MAFTLAQMRLILAIHEHGSLGQVHRVLNLTPPALSRNLKELERQLGVTLFERHPSGLRATKFCHAILPHARNAIGEAEQALEEVRILAGESRQMIRIGTLPLGSMTLLPSLIDMLLEEAAEIRVNVVEGIGEVLISGLKSREIDLVISGWVPEDDDIILALELGLEASCTLVVAQDHPFINSADQTVEDIINQRWVLLPPDSTFRQDFERLMRHRGILPPKPLVETRSTNLMELLVAEHGFVTWGPTMPFANKMKLVPLDVPEFNFQSPYNVYRFRGAARSGAMRRTLATLQRIVKATESREIKSSTSQSNTVLASKAGI